MIQVIQWPPLHYCTYSLLGRRFEQEDGEPFVVYNRDGTVDNDLTRQTPGFINRIQRFALQNRIAKKEWDEQSIYYSLLPKLPLELRPKFFKITRSDFQTTHAQVMNANPHHAPVPTGLAAAAGFGSVADSDPDLPQRLATLSPDTWVTVLKKWVDADPENRKTKTAAGPIWWYSLHTVALNPSAKIKPNNFVGEWLNRFPCRKCRIGARIYFARHPVPKDWSSFAAWADQLHQYVTSRKK